MMHHRISAATHKVNQTLAAIRGYVKIFVPKHPVSLGIFIISWSTIMAQGSVAHAEDAETRTMTNAIEMVSKLNGLVPDALPIFLRNLQEGRISRIAPEQPVWLLDASTGTIIYYQGQPAFARKDAAQLVDDAGQRFGQKAVDNARVSKPIWLTIKMGGQGYRAYCANRYPYVACSLNPKGFSMPDQLPRLPANTSPQ